MFECPRFATDDPRHAVELVRAHPFALVVSTVDGVPVGTHVPVIVEATVRAMESTRTPAWCPSARSRERFAQILQGVVAFRIHVTGEQSLFKLSQDIDAERRGRVQDELRSTGNVPLADLMEEVNSA